MNDTGVLVLLGLATVPPGLRPNLNGGGGLKRGGEVVERGA